MGKPFNISKQAVYEAYKRVKANKGSAGVDNESIMSFCKSAVKYTMKCLNDRLCKWAMCKYKRFRGHKLRAMAWLRTLAKREPNMFAHWTLGWKP